MLCVAFRLIWKKLEDANELCNHDNKERKKENKTITPMQIPSWTSKVRESIAVSNNTQWSMTNAEWDPWSLLGQLGGGRASRPTQVYKLCSWSQLGCAHAHIILLNSLWSRPSETLGSSCIEALTHQISNCNVKVIPWDSSLKCKFRVSRSRVGPPEPLHL